MSFVEQPEPPPLPPGPRPASRPALWLPVTVFCWTVTGVCVIWLVGLTWFTRPIDFLSDPIRAVAHIGEIDLDFAETARLLRPAEQWLYRFLGYSAHGAQQDVIGAYRRVLGDMESWQAGGEAVDRAEVAEALVDDRVLLEQVPEGGHGDGGEEGRR